MFVGQVAYYELNIEYITEKFCENKAKPELKCNGKCHLAKELQSLSQDTNSETESPQINFLAETFSPLFFQVEEKLEFDFLNANLLHRNYFYKTRSIVDYHSSLLRPPIV